jgi:hypothetical protein
MAEAKHDGENGKTVQLEVDQDLVAVPAHSCRSLPRRRTVQRPEVAPLSGTSYHMQGLKY